MEKGRNDAHREKPITSIGLVINPVGKPVRDIALGVMDCARAMERTVVTRLFAASPATASGNIAEFAASGLDAMVFCGVQREIFLGFLRRMPDHPPVVLCSYAPLSGQERALLGNGGSVVFDNTAISRQAAEFFLGHGLRNFSFVGSRVYGEVIACELREAAFRERLREELGEQMWYSGMMVGTAKSNGDFWDPVPQDVRPWFEALQLPCGIFVNGDREAFKLINLCNYYGIGVPEQVELISVNNSNGFCERARPTITSLSPDHMVTAKAVVELALALVDDPALPPERRHVRVTASKLVERGSTLGGRDYGHIVARAKEFVRINACKGIGVPDIVAHVGVSRRMLEKHIRKATGMSLLSMVQSARLEKVCSLLVTTSLPIAEVTVSAGYEPTSNLGKLFKKTYGMSMRQYRTTHK